MEIPEHVLLVAKVEFSKSNLPPSAYTSFIEGFKACYECLAQAEMTRQSDIQATLHQQIAQAMDEVAIHQQIFPIPAITGTQELDKLKFKH